MKFVLSGTLLRFTDYQKEIPCHAEDLQKALEELANQYPDLKKALFDREGNLRSAHRLFLNGTVIPRDQLDQSLKAEDCVDILTAVAGG